MTAHVVSAHRTTGNRVHALPNQLKKSISGVVGSTPRALASKTIIWKRSKAGITRIIRNRPSTPPHAANEIASQNTNIGTTTAIEVTG